MATPQGDYLYIGDGQRHKDFRTTAGACKPSGFQEYDNLSGYLERTYTKTWRDAQGNVWRKTVQVVNLGRPDRGIVLDPDAAIAHEPWQESKPPMQANAPSAAIEGHHRAKEARHDVLQAQILAYMHEHGAVQIKELEPVTGKRWDWLYKHLTEREHKAYRRVIVNANVHKWEPL